MHDHRDELLQFGRNVRSFRTQAGLSQEKLGEFADLDRTYVGGIERGERNPSLLNIIKLARALNVDARRLLDGVV